jgi:diacylglycerol O-acyltransferase
LCRSAAAAPPACACACSAASQIIKSKRTIRGSFPVDMRKANQDVLATQFGNQFSTCLFRFPLHYSDHISLVLDVKKQCDEIKISPEPYATLNLVNTLLKLPTSMQFGQLIKSFSKFTSMLSNVRGPDQKVSVCGCTVQDLRFYATAPIGLYFGVLSYAGTVTASVVLDSTCEADATAVAKHWGPAADILYKATVTDRPGELFVRKPSSAPKQPPKQQPEA